MYINEINLDSRLFDLFEAASSVATGAAAGNWQMQAGAVHSTEVKGCRTLGSGVWEDALLGAGCMHRLVVSDVRLQLEVSSSSDCSHRGNFCLAPVTQLCRFPIQDPGLQPQTIGDRVSSKAWLEICLNKRGGSRRAVESPRLTAVEGRGA